MFRFQGVESCVRICEEYKEAGMITFDHVTERAFQLYFDKREYRTTLGNWKTYDYDSQTINIMPEGFQHATTAWEFGQLLTRWAPQHERNLLRACGTANYPLNTRTKKPDGAWQPRDDQNRWPSLVVEVAKTESQSSLMDDVRFWICQSERNVQVVLSIKIKPGSIDFKKWKYNPKNPEQPACTQYMKIVRDASLTSSKVGAANPNRFFFSYKELTRKSEEPGQDCSGFTITKEQAIQLAETIWSV
ncbi:hypothetical protein N7462_005205 [Penicillium macrosclerotiorum]|uniref:uncharacterized protein n=1 Tax=Penicillium macrosclerotiorum TaxID=303699 RepID=UPI0025481006|nr:uncharacterized protein N7462_005205 [Penicillium macrosclerotiorum]KAJ5690813.1 hypothetical protein N7462_005205 [Penicillium macrosclerotiorum]